MDAESSTSMSSQLRYPTVKGYRIGEEIGGGGFSKVFRAIDDANCRVAACKVVNLFISPSIGYGTPDVKELQKEVQVHKSLTKPMKNEYILEFIHSEVVDKDKENDGWVPGLYIVLELAIGGDLFDKIAPDVGIPDDLANFYFAQLASGIDFIHQKGIAHRDLKPENLLLAANGNLKISDFGLCAVFKHKDKTRLLSGRCGSLPYVAPELGGPSGTGYKAEPVDIWGMGVVLYTMLCGNTPWDEPSENSPEFRAYLSGELLQYEPWTRLKGPALAMLLQLLTVNPDQRITMQQIKSHPWCMTSSQLTRAQMGDALTAGMRSTGMMAIADPVFTSQASQAYATNRSQRMTSESQFASQLNAQESQFLRATGNITQAGDFNTITTRFWLSLDPSQSLELLAAFLRADLGDQGVQLIPRSNGGDMAVQKTAGAKSIAGTFQVRGSDSLMEAKTLVIMRRGKGSILHWKAFWWSMVRDKRLLPYVIKGE